MLLSYNTNGLQNHRLDDALRLLADHGYQAVALTPDVGHLDPFSASAREVDGIAALLQRLNLQVAIETGARFVLDPAHKHEPTLMTRGGDARRRRIDFYTRCAAIGRDLGARVVSFWAGIDRSAGPDSEVWLDDGVRAACAAIRAQGLTPGLEPEPGMAIETVAQWRELRRRLGIDAPALTLDVGHLYAVWEGEPAAIIADHAAFLVQVHLEDMPRGQHEHLLPGTGDVAFSTILKALKESGYEHHSAFELSRHSHLAPTAIAICRDVWRQFVGCPGR